MSMLPSPMSDDEIEELGRVTLHGPLPDETVKRLWLGALRVLRQRVEVREVLEAVDEYIVDEVDKSEKQERDAASRSGWDEASGWQRRKKTLRFVQQGLRELLLTLPRPATGATDEEVEQMRTIHIALGRNQHPRIGVLLKTIAEKDALLEATAAERDDYEFKHTKLMDQFVQTNEEYHEMRAALRGSQDRAKKLRGYLLDVINHGTDGGATSDVSDDFLSHVAAECAAVKKQRDDMKKQVAELQTETMRQQERENRDLASYDMIVRMAMEEATEGRSTEDVIEAVKERLGS